MDFEVTEQEILTFERDGAICLRQVFSPDWVAKVTKGIDSNLRNPSKYSESLQGPNGGGAYFNDYCNWRQIPEFKDYILNSPVGALAGKFMRSSKSVFYHEHVLVKEGGTDKETPWHVDISYYPIEATQCLSIWMPVDRVEIQNTLTFVAGSHRWFQWFMPRKFATGLNYPSNKGYEDKNGRQWVDIPCEEDINKETILGWSLNPGDCVIFHMRTMHGAAGNSSQFPRRILSTRWLGDDAMIANRPWDVSPPMTGNLQVGQAAVSEEFPVVWTQ